MSYELSNHLDQLSINQRDVDHVNELRLSCDSDSDIENDIDTEGEGSDEDDELSDISDSDMFDNDAYLIANMDETPEESAPKILSLDEVSFDRDIRYVNVAAPIAPKPAKPDKVNSKNKFANEDVEKLMKKKKGKKSLSAARSSEVLEANAVPVRERKPGHLFSAETGEFYEDKGKDRNEKKSRRGGSRNKGKTVEGSSDPSNKPSSEKKQKRSKNRKRDEDSSIVDQKSTHGNKDEDGSKKGRNSKNKRNSRNQDLSNQISESQEQTGHQPRRIMSRAPALSSSSSTSYVPSDALNSLPPPFYPASVSSMDYGYGTSTIWSGDHDRFSSALANPSYSVGRLSDHDNDYDILVVPVPPTPPPSPLISSGHRSVGCVPISYGLSGINYPQPSFNISSNSHHPRERPENTHQDAQQASFARPSRKIFGEPSIVTGETNLRAEAKEFVPNAFRFSMPQYPSSMSTSVGDLTSSSSSSTSSVNANHIYSQY